MRGFDETMPDDAIFKKGLPDDDYFRDRQIRDAHQAIDFIAGNKKRQVPVEVEQAHHIGTLEADLRNCQTHAQELHRKNEVLEETVKAQADNISATMRIVDGWEKRALESERLYNNLRAKRSKKGSK